MIALKRIKNGLFGLLICVVLLGCEDTIIQKQVHPLNFLFKNNSGVGVLYDFRKSPDRLEQELIEQIPLRACDNFGTCELRMNFVINYKDTICLPVYLDGLFKTEYTPLFCGNRNRIYLQINQNNKLLYEERPIELNALKTQWLSDLTGRGSDKVFFMSIKWHVFTSVEVREKVFAIFLEVITSYYEQESQNKFNKPILKLTSAEKETLINETVQIKFYQAFNKKVALPVRPFIHKLNTEI